MGLTKEAWAEIIEDRKSEYRIDPINLYSDGYFRRRSRGKRDRQMKAGKILSDLFDIKSMVDFGCGLGAYLEGAFNGKTQQVLGIDACYDRLLKYTSENIRPFIVRGHVGKKLDLGKWDCVLSLEIAEHLLPEEEDVFIDNILMASSRLIVFRAGPSFNRHHLNPGKERNYWIDKFLQRDCVELIEEERKLTQAWRGHVGRRTRKNIIVMQIEDHEDST